MLALLQAKINRMQEFGRDEIRDETNEWLARYAPLVMPSQRILTADEVHGQLKALEELRVAAPTVLDRSRNLIGPDAPQLVTTLQQAVGSLDGLENDLRRTLASLEPGNPKGIVDLDALQKEIAEREARSELGVVAAQEIPAVLELNTNPGNLAAAGGLGIFAFGWLSFTTFHMVLMIGGMMHAFGFGALALLGFYAIFYAAGIAMAVSAFNAGAKEDIRLEGRTLTILRVLLGIRKLKTVNLAADAQAEVGRPQMTMNNRNTIPAKCILIPDTNGRVVTLGSSVFEKTLREHCSRINAYLAVHGKD